MNVGELRELLEDYEDDVEVAIATQPAWPLAFEVGEVIEIDPHVPEDEDEEDEEPENELGDMDRDHHDGKHIVWITTGSGLWPDPYAPRRLFGDLR
jgi:hypothetical protein